MTVLRSTRCFNPVGFYASGIPRDYPWSRAAREPVMGEPGARRAKQKKLLFQQIFLTTG